MKFILHDLNIIRDSLHNLLKVAVKVSLKALHLPTQQVLETALSEFGIIIKRLIRLYLKNAEVITFTSFNSS